MKTKCICPRCGRVHYVALEYEWTGRGVLKKYCHKHLPLSYNEDAYVVEAMSFRSHNYLIEEVVEMGTSPRIIHSMVSKEASKFLRSFHHDTGNVMEKTFKKLYAQGVISNQMHWDDSSDANIALLRKQLVSYLKTQYEHKDMEAEIILFAYLILRNRREGERKYEADQY